MRKPEPTRGMPPFVVGKITACRECGAVPHTFVCGACYCAEHLELGFVREAREGAEAVGAPPDIVNAIMDGAREVYAMYVNDREP